MSSSRPGHAYEAGFHEEGRETPNKNLIAEGNPSSLISTHPALSPLLSSPLLSSGLIARFSSDKLYNVVKHSGKHERGKHNGTKGIEEGLKAIYRPRPTYRTCAKGGFVSA